MATNILEAAPIFMEALDRQIVEGSTTGWMESSAGQVKYIGGSEVKIPKVSVSGLADYDREKGYNQGAVSLEYETRKMTQDRGRQFHLDRMDVDETNFIATASMVMSEFQRTKIIPEIDAYRYSKIYSLTPNENRRNYSPASASILSTLSEDISKVRNVVGDSEELTITISHTASNLLDSNDKIQKYINVAEFQQGSINFKVKTFDNIPLIRVGSSRMKTEFVFNDGKTEGQKEGGFTPAEGSKNINWIIAPKRALIAISKTDNIKIFTPDQNQVADAWKLQYRKFHDLWIKDSYLSAIFICAG